MRSRRWPDRCVVFLVNPHKMAIFYHVCSTSYFDSLPVFNNILIVIRIICPNVTIGNLLIILQKDILFHYFMQNVSYE